MYSSLSKFTKRLAGLTALGFVLTISACGSADDKKSKMPAAEMPAMPKTSIADLGRRIERLSSDEFKGRAPSTPGGIAASQYIADEMQAIGLEPMGDNGTYFQRVPLSETTALPSSSLTISNPLGEVLEAKQGENAVFWSKRLDKTLDVTNSEMVFVGYGITAPEYGWDDYAGLDVKGKTVVMLVNDPGFATQDAKLFRGNSMTYYGRWTYKFEQAGQRGAAAALIIHETKPASYGWNVVSGSWTGPQYDLVRPDGGASRTLAEGWLSTEAARRVIANSGLDLDTLKAAAAKPGFTPVPLPGLTLNAHIAQDVETVTSRNVAGAIKGTKRPDEYVLYMAHWDHLGEDPELDGDQIFNGAVDNATGTAAVLEIAEAFTEHGAPERSAIFVAVTAEESGLLGSAYYGADPIVPLNKTVAGINIDGMVPVGETKDLIVVGYGLSELEDLLNTQLDQRGMHITPDTHPEAGYFFRSDHISLAKLGVPMLYADSGVDHVSKGLSYGESVTEDYVKYRYHKPSDEYNHSWDLTGINQASEILFDMGYDLANSQSWPSWYDGSEFKALREAMMQE